MDLRLVHDIKHVAGFLGSRNRLGYIDDSLADSMASQMASQINNLACLDADAATRLTDALATSCYTQAGKDNITKAIDAKVQMVSPSKGRGVKIGNKVAGAIGGLSEDAGDFEIFTGIAITCTLFGLLIIAILKPLKRLTHGAEDFQENK